MYRSSTDHQDARIEGAPLTWRIAGLLAVMLVLAIGLHGWPMTGVPAMRFFWPANVVVLAWVAWILLGLYRSETRDALRGLLPPACVWAYLVVSLLSVAAAENPARAGTTAVKMALCLVGTYTLVAAACRTQGRAAWLLWALAAVVSGVIAHAATQMFRGQAPTALFESPLKLGSFLAMTVPFAASYLAACGHPLIRFWALLRVVGSLLVCGSAWAWLGIVVGVIVGTVTTARLRRWLAGTLVVAAVAINGLVISGGRAVVISDVQWREEIGRDVRQRYLEWQALINLLKDRSAVGTGVGCLNDRRSEYYLRLPKNNTIAPFDQNGYLAAAAEMGVPGLIAWCWVLGEYLKKGWRRRNDMVIRAAWSGVAAATVAQVASSLTYNGILVVFVVLLALIDHEEGRSEDAPI